MAALDGHAEVADAPAACAYVESSGDDDESVFSHRAQLGQAT